MSAKRSPGRKLNIEELGEVFTLATNLGFSEPDDRTFLLEELPAGFSNHLKRFSAPSSQLQNDLNELNRLDALTGLTGRPLAAWLRAAVRLAQQRCRVEAADLKRLLALVEDPPPEAAAVGRLRALITAVLASDPTLCARLATWFGRSADPDSLAEHCMSLSVEALIDPLLDIAQTSTDLRQASARLAQVVLPAATDWQAFRTAQRTQGPGTVHLEVPFLIGPLCEVVVAAAQDRAAQLEHRDQISAAVPMPSLNLLAVLPGGKDLHLLVAENILLQRRRRDQLPKDPVRLLEEARKAITFRRDKLAPDKRYQMYLVFENAEPGALRALAGGLPDLWLVEGRREDDQTLLDTLHELFGWS